MADPLFTLEDLPLGLLEEILALLPLDDLMNMGSVSRGMRHLVTELAKRKWGCHPTDVKPDKRLWEEARRRRQAVRLAWLLGGSSVHHLAASGRSAALILTEGDIHEMVETSPGRHLTPLSFAILAANAETVRGLLRAGAARGAAQLTHALCEAAAAGDLPLVDLLLGHGADVEGSLSERPLCEAAGNGHLDVVERLLELGANVECDGGMPLNEAAGNGHLAIVERLLLHGADVEGDDGGDGTNLYWAAYSDHVDVVERLLQHGADVNGRGGLNALHAAADFGHLGVVKALIAAGADVNFQDVDIDGGEYCDTTTLLQSAAYKGHLGVVEALLGAGADVNRQGSLPEGGPDGTALHLALLEGRYGVVRMLLQVPGININAANTSGDTALHVAARRAPVTVVEWLLDVPGIHTGARGWHDCTALNLAEGYEWDARPDVAALLRKRGCVADAVPPIVSW